MAQPKVTYTSATGRRKSAVARVRIAEGTGRFIVNRRESDIYFPLDQERSRIVSPMRLLNCEKQFDVFVQAEGGGLAAQSGAISLGLARALLLVNPDYEQVLRGNKLLTRDARQKERKKYGQRGARRGFQFSKR